VSGFILPHLTVDLIATVTGHALSRATASSTLLAAEDVSLVAPEVVRSEGIEVVVQQRGQQTVGPLDMVELSRCPLAVLGVASVRVVSDCQSAVAARELLGRNQFVQPEHLACPRHVFSRDAHLAAEGRAVRQSGWERLVAAPEALTELAKMLKLGVLLVATDVVGTQRVVISVKHVQQKLVGRSYLLETPGAVRLLCIWTPIRMKLRGKSVVSVLDFLARGCVKEAQFPSALNDRVDTKRATFSDRLRIGHGEPPDNNEESITPACAVLNVARFATVRANG